MPPSTIQHRRAHNLLLISKLLNQRDATSPFTLVQDSLEQSGQPLVAEFVKRANAAKVSVIFISFETLQRPKAVDAFIPAWRLSPQAWQRDVAEVTKSSQGQRKLLIIDSMNALSASSPSTLPTLLSSIINPSTSLLALYHTDIPQPASVAQKDPYSPSSLALLSYLATTIFTTHSLHHVLARKAARDRSLAEPSFGLLEGVEGVLQGLGSTSSEGFVLEMEHRRKSGRGVKEWFVLPGTAESRSAAGAREREGVVLLEDHPSYRADSTDGVEGTAGADLGSTFDLGLTERQRRDRDGVVLPYFDAQTGNDEGGRILYDMGVEDDFDEEEDEI